jgi:hypothetical protein
MNIIELQNSIIRKILNTKDNQLLNYLNNILLKEEAPSVYQFSDFEKQMINESLADYEKGNTISNDEVFSKTKKWLEE